MKCSLLSLSTYIDGELTPDRRAELDAHMVGCPRCSAGASTLREEKLRISQLARVRVPSPSAQMMLEQVGITGVTMLRQPQRPVVQEPATPPLPWQDTSRRAAALPWAPTRPVVAPSVTAPPAAPPATVGAPTAVPAPMPAPSHVQPGLPIDDEPAAAAPAAAEPPSIEAVPMDVPEPQSEQEQEPLAAVVPDAAAVDEGPAFEEMAAYAETVALEDPVEEHQPQAWTSLETEEGSTDVEVAGLRHDMLGGVVENPETAPPASWETALPPPIDDDASPTPWTAPAATPAELHEPPALPAAAPAGPPQKLAPAGPGAVWTRLRDAVAVRFALASGRGVADDGVEIVTGPAPRRSEVFSERTAPVDDPVATPGSGTSGPLPELTAVAAVELPEPNVPASRARWEPEALDAVPPESASPADSAPARGRPSWNAFAASSYEETEKPQATPAAPRSRPLGRHSRALARDTRALGARISAAVAGAAAALPFSRRAGAGTSTRAHKTARPAVPRRVMTVGIAAVGVVFLLALVVGRVTTPSPRVTSVTASLSPTGTTAPTAIPSAPANSAPAASSAPAATAAPAPIAGQSFGSGGTGFQIQRIRYGQQPGFFRTVFDIGAASGTVSGTPRVDLAMPDARTILLTFSGTVAAGSTGAPGGSTISSVTLVSNSGGKVQYRITLDQPATANAFYLDGPTRFVLDLR